MDYRKLLLLAISQITDEECEYVYKILSNERETVRKHEQNKEFCSVCGKRKRMKPGIIEKLCEC